MEIIKPGDLSRLKQTKTFKCCRCGCEFLADKSEYRYGGTQYNTIYYVCNCPTCNNQVYVEE